MIIEIDTKINDLEFVRYNFWLKETDLYLESMFFLERKSKRHKLSLVHEKSYHRILNREFGVKEEPDIDIEVIYEAIRIARSKINFKKWKPR